MIAKALTGVDFFDETYGGTYQGRVMLASGRSGSGKTILGLQFLAQGLKQDERGLLLSARPAEDVALYAAAYGISAETAIESNNLIILEYSEFVPGRDREDQLKLPPDSFIQLKQIIEEQAVNRVVLDTVLPWVALTDAESLAEHVFSFVRVFHRLGCTSLFTMPKPASAAAFRLRRLLEDVIPVSVSLGAGEDDQTLHWHVNKYLGAERVGEDVPYEIKPKHGIIRKGTPSGRRAAEPTRTPSRTAFPDSPNESAARVPPRITPPVAPPQERPGGGKPSFSDLILQDGAAMPTARGRPNAKASGNYQPMSGWSSIRSAASHT